MARETVARFGAGARIGDYRVEHELAVEETSVVYVATHVVLPRQAHLKVTHPGARTAAVQVLREACILEALSHAGIPRIHECGVLAESRPWTATERMTGATLKQLAGDGALALSDLVVLVRDVADILAHAHERGVVHRRLTASAVVRTSRRRCAHAVVAWGDARTLDSATHEVVDARDDVRALGELAFRALTGRAFEAGATARFATAAPAELARLIDEMLAEPVARPPASEVFERAMWLCETLEAAPLMERPRWTPPQGFAPEPVATKPASARLGTDDDLGTFAIRIGRARTNG